MDRSTCACLCTCTCMYSGMVLCACGLLEAAKQWACMSMYCQLIIYCRNHWHSNTVHVVAVQQCPCSAHVVPV